MCLVYNTPVWSSLSSCSVLFITENYNHWQVYHSGSVSKPVVIVSADSNVFVAYYLHTIVDSVTDRDTCIAGLVTVVKCTRHWVQGTYHLQFLVYCNKLCYHIIYK